MGHFSFDPNENVILRDCDFFDVVKNRSCKQNSYDDKLVINSKKPQTLSAAGTSQDEVPGGVEGRNEPGRELRTVTDQEIAATSDVPPETSRTGSAYSPTRNAPRQ